MQRYPQSQLDIRLVDKLMHLVKDGFDVVFGVGHLEDSSLIARKLGQGINPSKQKRVAKATLSDRISAAQSNR